MIKNESKSMIFSPWGLVECVLRAQNAMIWSYFWIFCIGNVLGGLVDVGWAILGPWKQLSLAKHIAKPSKLQNNKIKIPSPCPPFDKLKKLSKFSLSKHVNNSNRLHAPNIYFPTNHFGYRTGRGWSVVGCNSCTKTLGAETIKMYHEVQNACLL